MNIQVEPTSSNLASAMLNSKIRPRAVVGYGVKIFHPSPPNYVTRSPGNDFAIYLSRRIFMVAETKLFFSFFMQNFSLLFSSFIFSLFSLPPSPIRQSVFQRSFAATSQYERVQYFPLSYLSVTISCAAIG